MFTTIKSNVNKTSNTITSLYQSKSKINNTTYPLSPNIITLSKTFLREAIAVLNRPIYIYAKIHLITVTV